MQEGNPCTSVIRNAAALAKGETPALQAPATNVEDAGDDSVLVHLVGDVKTHGGGMVLILWVSLNGGIEGKLGRVGEGMRNLGGLTLRFEEGRGGMWWSEFVREL